MHVLDQLITKNYVFSAYMTNEANKKMSKKKTKNYMNLLRKFRYLVANKLL